MTWLIAFKTNTYRTQPDYTKEHKALVIKTPIPSISERKTQGKFCYDNSSQELRLLRLSKSITADDTDVRAFVSRCVYASLKAWNKEMNAN